MKKDAAALITPWGTKLSRYIAVILLVTFFVFMGVSLSNFLPGIFVKNTVEAVEGVLDLSGVNLTGTETYRIVGQWERLTGICYCSGGKNHAPHVTPALVSIPMSLKILDGYLSPVSSLYRLRIVHDAPVNDIRLYLSPIRGYYSVLLNNEVVFSRSRRVADASVMPIFNISVFGLEFDNDRPYQELTISICEAFERVDFYKSNFVIGTTAALSKYLANKVVIWALIFGFVSMLVISRGVFMAICPEYRVISFYTVMDLSIIIRLLFGIPELLHVSEFMLGFYVPIETIARLRLLSVMIIGIASIIFTDMVFNPEGKINKTVSRLVVSFTVVVAAALWISISSMGNTLSVVVLATLAITATTYVVYCIITFLRYYTPTKSHICKIVLMPITAIAVTYDLMGLRNISGNFVTLLLVLFALSFFYLLNDILDKNSSYKQHIKLSRDFKKNVEQQTRMFRQAYTRLKKSSFRDYLTGAYNRFYFENRLRDNIFQFQKSPYNLFLSILDLDRFKQINDTYGHDAGDEQIKQFVEAAQQIAPESMVVARLGGEEFAVMAENVSEAAFLTVLENIRRATEETALKDERRTTVSIGAVKFEAGMNMKQFLKRADECLYEAKCTGRNKTVVYNIDGGA